MGTDSIEHEQLVILQGTTSPVRSRWTYRTDEPYAVTVAFCTERGRWVEWVFARELLLVGLTEPAGVGDLHIRPGADEDTLTMQIRSPSGSAVFTMETEAIEDFLATTLELVPAGEEEAHFDVDRLLAELVGD